MSSIILIGMPGAGKSTVGVLLAKRLAKAFVDTDLIIQQEANCSLQEYLDEHGYLALRALEEKVLLQTKDQNSVIATGGSAVYSEEAMQNLGRLGPILYVQISLDVMLQRVKNQASRGLASAPGVSLEEIFREREELYEKYADRIVVGDKFSPEGVVEEIVSIIDSI